jgi:hypothetical protein
VRIIHIFYVLLLSVAAAYSFGVGLNYRVGFGVFCALWCIAEIVWLKHD